MKPTGASGAEEISQHSLNFVRTKLKSNSSMKPILVPSYELPTNTGRHSNLVSIFLISSASLSKKLSTFWIRLSESGSLYAYFLVVQIFQVSTFMNFDVFSELVTEST